MHRAIEIFKNTEKVKLKKDWKIAIIGSGMGGLMAAYYLKIAGVRDFTILEKAQSIGGTWRDNRFPGAACDVPSHLYRFSFLANPNWSSSSAPADEIVAYMAEIVDRFGLEDHIRFGQNVVSCRRESGQWVITTSDGTVWVVDAIISSTGFLHHPVIPAIEGLDDFAGPVFHSSRWPDIDLTGKRVANIGSGSTGAQIITSLVDTVGHLDVFQRSANWVMPFPVETYSEEQQERYRKDPSLLDESFSFLMGDLHRVFGEATSSNSQLQQPYLEECLGYLNTIKDDKLRRKMTPKIPFGCRRLVLSSNFFEAIQRENCEVITDPILRIEKDGIRTKDGALHEEDVIVLSTGFKSHDYCRSIGLVGEDGITLDDVWKDGVVAFESVTLAGFPNFFMIGGPMSAVGNSSYTLNAELQITYIINMLAMLEEAGASAAKPRHDAQKRFQDYVREGGEGTDWTAPGCSSWFKDERGNLLFWTRPLDEFIELFGKGPSAEDYEIIR